ncbi:MAG: hypothetical protein ACLPTF_10130 [Steroidobacteraceae bacterium]
MAPRDQLPPLDPLQRYSVNEALQYLRTSRQSFYTKFVNPKRIQVIREGSRCFVPGSEIVRLSRAENQAA